MNAYEIRDYIETDKAIAGFCKELEISNSF